jgi:hypothetical protein
MFEPFETLRRRLLRRDRHAENRNLAAARAAAIEREVRPVAERL